MGIVTLPRFQTAALLLGALLLLTACGGGGGRSPYGGTKHPIGVKLGKPYSVMGQYYEPKYDPNYEETGMASWYGPGFDGRMTASGERFDASEITCAHRTLPMPSLVRVTRTDNGRSIIARVNDRGPFKKERILDLSEASAAALGIKGTGTAHVKVKYLQEETEEYLAAMDIPIPYWMKQESQPRTLDSQYASMQWGAGRVTSRDEGTATAAPLMNVSVSTDEMPIETIAPSASLSIAMSNEALAPASGGSSSYMVQTGSFKQRTNAESQLARLEGVGAPDIRENLVKGERFYRVVLGPVPEHSQAQQMLERVRSLGFTDARILVE